MKKFTKIMARVLPIVLVGLLVVTNVFGITPPKQNDLPTGKGANGTVEAIAGNVWSTVVLIVRILAVAAIVFAGLRYMFASANDKADIKKQLVILVVGAVLVFGATFILELITNVSQSVLSET